MMEEWRIISDFPNYSVSSHGRVRNDIKNTFLTGTVRNDGYIQVYLGGKLKGYYLIHRLVLTTFVGPCPAGLLACHEDDDPSNNKLSNLRWDTPRSNSHDRVRNHRNRGIDAASAKLSREDVLEICRRIDADEKFSEISKAVSVPMSVITHINVGNTWAWLTGRSSDNARCPTHKNHSRKLTKKSVKEIARLICEKKPMTDIARLFDVKPQTIQQIKSGRIWSHVTGLGRE